MKRRNFLFALAGLPLLSRAAPPALNPWAESYCISPIRRAAVMAPTPGGLRYQGTHILTYGALRELSASYNRLGRGPVDVTGGGCDDGITGVLRGEAELGGMCCPVEGSRAAHLPSLLVARDIKVVVAHPSVALPDISMGALRQVARGGIRRWSELGDADRAIVLVVRNHCPDYMEPVRDLLLDNRPDWSSHALFIETDQQLVETVARYPGAVGVVSRALALPYLKSGQLRAVTVNGVAPEREAAESGAYPLMGPLNIVFREWDEARMRGFFDFLYSPLGAAIIGQALVPVSAREAGYGAVAV